MIRATVEVEEAVAQDRVFCHHLMRILVVATFHMLCEYLWRSFPMQERSNDSWSAAFWRGFGW